VDAELLLRETKLDFVLLIIIEYRNYSTTYATWMEVDTYSARRKVEVSWKSPGLIDSILTG
jgi:hypothetical protein